MKCRIGLVDNDFWSSEPRNTTSGRSYGKRWSESAVLCVRMRHKVVESKVIVTKIISIRKVFANRITYKPDLERKSTRKQICRVGVERSPHINHLDIENLSLTARSVRVNSERNGIISHLRVRMACHRTRLHRSTVTKVPQTMYVVIHIATERKRHIEAHFGRHITAWSDCSYCHHVVFPHNSSAAIRILHSKRDIVATCTFVCVRRIVLVACRAVAKVPSCCV